MSSRRGYKNPFLLLPFPDLADGASVLIRNPNLLPPEKLQKIVAATQGDDDTSIFTSMAPVLVDVIVAWRNLYPSDDDLQGVDLDGEEDLAALMARLEEREQQPLKDITAANIARLPMKVIMEIAQALKFGEDEPDADGPGTPDPTQP